MSHFITIDQGQLQQQQTAIESRGDINMATYKILAATDLVIMPGAAGSLLADCTGDTRGLNVVDLQFIRSASSQVASGDHAVLLGGEDNTSSGDYAALCGGFSNTASGNFSVLVGGDRNQNLGLDGVLVGGVQNLISQDSDDCQIMGGLNNSITTSNQAAIVGGRNQVSTNGSQTGMYSGKDNSITSSNRSAICSGAFIDFVGSPYSGTIGGEFQTITNSSYSAIIGGRSNNITDGEFSGMVAAQLCNINRPHSSATGMNVETNSFGERAFGMPHRADQPKGGCQYSEFIVSGRTTNSTQTRLWIDNDGATESIIVPPDSCWSYKVLVSGLKDNGSKGAGYEIRGVCRRDGTAGITSVGGPTVTTLGEDDSNWGATVTFGTDTFKVQVTGGSSETVYWSAHVRAQQVRI